MVPNANLAARKPPVATGRYWPTRALGTDGLAAQRIADSGLTAMRSLADRRVRPTCVGGRPEADLHHARWPTET